MVTEADSTRGNERAQQLMMGALDGELSDTERGELNSLLDADAKLREEWQRLQNVKEVTSTMALRSPPEEVWDHYWTSVYSRFERRVGWILLSLGAIVLLSYGLWTAAQEILADATLPGVVKAAVFVVVVGTVVLLVSVIREKWFVHKSDPYKDVQR